jgi:hypothetical protein
LHGNFRALLALMLAGVIAAVVIVQSMSGFAHDPPSNDQRKAQYLATVSAGTPVPVRTKSPADEAFVASVNAATESSRLEYRDWLEEFNASGIDPATLTRVKADVFTAFSPAANLDAAADLAHLIVTATATEVRFLPSNTLVTFKIDSVAKTPSDVDTQEVTVLFPFGPNPDPKDPSRAVLYYLPAAPIVLKGERAVLLLRELPPERVAINTIGLDTSKRHWSAQPFVGVYKITAAGSLDYLREENPHDAEVRDKTPAQLFESFKQAALN